MKKKFSFTIIFFIVGVFLAITISSSAIKEAYRNRKIEKEVEQLKQEAQHIQNENKTIQQRIGYYSTPQFVEKISKDKMSLQKPDENVVVVKKSSEKPAESNIIEKNEEKDNQDIPNYAKWWNLFFKY